MEAIIREKLKKLLDAFCPILYEDDETFLRNMKDRNLAGDDIARYRHWEWTQGVGLFGLWKLYAATGERRYLDILTDFFDRQLRIGFPALNVNTLTPFLAMAFVGEALQEEKYLAPCKATAAWVFARFPRTKEGGFQHMTSDTLNDQELWDDTLFMTVLFLAKMGLIEKKQEYQAEAEKQFLLHAKYLADPQTGLWYHGWTFNGCHHFAGAFWGRGNCWVTMAIPEFLAMTPCTEETQAALQQLLSQQAESLTQHQDANGMWHTLIDDPTSYAEASATCGFGYGLLRSVHLHLLPARYEKAARRALPAILSLIGEDGILQQVSYGTPMGRDSKDFYKQIPIRPMPYGQAMAMLFLIESLE